MLLDSFSKLFSNSLVNKVGSNIDLKGNQSSNMTLDETNALKTENILFTRPNFGLV